jgi:hypothetical protein
VSDPPGFLDVARLLWRRRGPILVLVAAAVMGAGLVVASRVPTEESRARYRAADAALATEVDEAIRLRLFPLEAIADLDLTVQRIGHGLLVTATGDRGRARTFLEALPARFRRVEASLPGEAVAPSAPRLPSPPIPPVPPAPAPSAPVGDWQRELLEVERRLASGPGPEEAYLTARALRLREMVEAARQAVLVAEQARARYDQEVDREQRLYAQRVEAERARHAAVVGAPRARPAPVVRELVMVHPVLIVPGRRPWGAVLVAAVVGALVLGSSATLVLESARVAIGPRAPVDTSPGWVP